MYVETSAATVRIWATGNGAEPAAKVPLSVGTWSFAGAGVNAALVAWDFDTAVQDPAAWPQVAPVGLWKERYAGAGRVWSLSTGRALGLDCDEDAGPIWLAQRGRQTTGIDISPTAVARATTAAEAGVRSS